MAADFLTDKQTQNYGRYAAEPNEIQLARYFHLDERDLTFINRHCCKVSDEAAFCLIQRPYISKTLLTRRISPRGSP